MTASSRQSSKSKALGGGASGVKRDSMAAGRQVSLRSVG